MSKSEITVEIDVEKAISNWNKKNPEKRQMLKKTVTEKTGLSKSTLRNWQNGKGNPTLIALYDFLELTQCKMKDILKVEKNGRNIV